MRHESLRISRLRRLMANVFPFSPCTCQAKTNAKHRPFPCAITSFLSITCACVPGKDRRRPCAPPKAAALLPIPCNWPAKHPVDAPLHLSSPCTSLESENLYRHQSRRFPRRQYRCEDRDAHRRRRDPQPIEQARMKRHVRHCVYLRVQRDQPIGSCDPREGVTRDQTENRAGRTDCDSQQQENLADLVPPRANRK